MSKFILITVNDDYDEATHSFAKEYDVAINPDQISSIEDLTIDDPEYKNKRGSTISMADGRVYTAEAYSIEELLRIIDGKMMIYLTSKNMPKQPESRLGNQ